MNIKITYNWLLEYLQTDTNPFEIQKYLSLCGPSIEKVEKIGDDYVFDVEITSNRVDAASVFGIAQEAVAILPMFGEKAKLNLNPLTKYRFNFVPSEVARPNNKQLNIIIKNPNLCSRFTTIVLDNIQIKKSPDFIRKRLTACGIKSINNVVDISNYLMLALGQPTHIFDYDKIGRQTMIMRGAKRGETIITLDGKKIALPGGDIIIEDGRGQLIDLCGIMGGLNSAVSDKTDRVVLFVQTYNKQLIRKTSMTTGQRTVAATYFEKGLDEERVEPTLVYGVELLQKYAAGRIASKLYDIYPKQYQKKSLVVDYSLLEKIIGVKIEKKLINNILKNLGFKVYNISDDRRQSGKIEVPSWRKDDVNIPEDIIEEIARIYGYHNLPNTLPPVTYVVQPKEAEQLFDFQSKTKIFLKHLGLNEVANYSMISGKMIEDFGLKTADHLHIANSISREIEYMRTTLLPSLYKNIEDNRGKREVLKFFEIAKVYLPQKNDLPKEVYKLGVAVNSDFFDLKGIVESLYQELNINKEVSQKIIAKNNIFLVEIDLDWLMANAATIAAYQPINPYAVIKLDLTVTLSKKLNFAVIKKIATAAAKLLQKIEVVDTFNNKITLRFYFTSNKRNITADEAKEELERIRLLVLK